MMNRRTFLKQTGAFSAALFLPACLNKVKEEIEEIQRGGMPDGSSEN